MIDWLLNFVNALMVFLGLVLIYGMYRNQRAAAGSDEVDTSNFGPRIAAIVEVVLHPDRAVGWYREVEPIDDEEDIKTWKDNGNAMFWKRVFPALGQDSSEQYGIREDDGKTE